VSWPHQTFFAAFQLVQKTDCRGIGSKTPLMSQTTDHLPNETTTVFIGFGQKSARPDRDKLES
jgi:hypothetical protein